jgi:hypothetical protein
MLCSGGHRAFGVPEYKNCTLWTFRGPRSESVFFASFLFRFGKRNDVPPRTVANSDKEISQNKTREDPESSNPALTQSTNPKTTPNQPRV